MPVTFHAHVKSSHFIPSFLLTVNFSSQGQKTRSKYAIIVSGLERHLLKNSTALVRSFNFQLSSALTNSACQPTVRYRTHSDNYSSTPAIRQYQQLYAYHCQHGISTRLLTQPSAVCLRITDERCFLHDLIRLGLSKCTSLLTINYILVNCRLELSSDMQSHHHYQHFISERELMCMFAICRRPSVCLSVCL